MIKNPREADHEEYGSMSLGYCHNDTGGDFSFSYRKTDGWRGYYELSSETFYKAHDDTILAGSDDEKNLKKFNDYVPGII